MKNVFSGVKSFVGKGYNKYVKGVSEGGEEFIAKLNRLNLKNPGFKRPIFMVGTFANAIKTINIDKPFLLYLSGDD